jgi:hypothetical protein
MIVFRGGPGGGCSVLGCLPLLLIGVVITILVLVLSGGHMFFFAV